ncbi:MAG: glycerophosphodiester phosphodiesterase family protein [Pseudomonadota bacterium]
MSLKLPNVIGHRGAASYAPENTLEGIHTAADMGVKWVELDVKLTKDDVPILFHDDELDRTTNGSGKVAETKYEDIQQLETGSWFGESFTGIKVPTLEEAIEVLIDRDLGLNLEIKPCAGRETETAEAALDILSQYWDERSNLLISSFQHGCLEVSLDIAQDWARGLLIGGEEIPEHFLDIADHLDVKTVNVSTSLANHEIVLEIIEKELTPLIYTVNDPIQAREYQSMGVKTLFSDEPDILLEHMLSVH